MGNDFWSFAGLSIAAGLIVGVLAQPITKGVPYCKSVYTLYQNTCDLKRIKP